MDMSITYYFYLYFSEKEIERVYNDACRIYRYYIMKYSNMNQAGTDRKKASCIAQLSHNSHRKGRPVPAVPSTTWIVVLKLPGVRRNQHQLIYPQLKGTPVY